VTRNSKARWLQAAVVLSTLASGLLTSGRAAAEVTIVKGQTWEVYVAGRAGAFLSYNWGEGPPVPPANQPDSMIQAPVGAGVDTFQPPHGVIYEYDAMGMPITTKQGKIQKMRVRSGTHSNILTLGMHKQLSPTIKLTAQMSIWGTIESDDTKGVTSLPANGIRDNGVSADFREGFLQLDAPWGSVTAGRFMGIVGRGATEIDTLYGHGYGVGFPIVSRGFNLPATGDVNFPGPTAGMGGFGLLAGYQAAGVMYATPSLSGLKVSVGVFDASNYGLAAWNTTRIPRPEAEVAYDLHAGNINLHVFGSGGVQKLYNGNSPLNATIWAANYGGRFEIGPLHIGAGGFMGKGAGVVYAFDDNPAMTSTSTTTNVFNPATNMNVAIKDYQVRMTRGYFGMAQVALGPVDIGGGVGQTQILLLDEDKAVLTTKTLPDGSMVQAISPLKTLTGFFGAVVYHINESLHLDVDFMNGSFKWYNTEHQKMNVVSGGATLTF
jgi:hypothetical protein